jgi:aspartate/methionine/tyrosine aminotransferase
LKFTTIEAGMVNNINDTHLLRSYNYTPKNNKQNTISLNNFLLQNQNPTMPTYKNLIAFYGLNIRPAERLDKSDYKTPEYINEITRARNLYGDQEVIELGMGNPDILPPEGARKTLQKNIEDLWAHRYNFPKGEWRFRKGVSDWFNQRFGVNLNPSIEVMMSAGASDGVDLILSGYTEKGDNILVPVPGYTVFRGLIARNDLVPVPLNLEEKNNYFPDFSKIKEEDLKGV